MYNKVLNRIKKEVALIEENTNNIDCLDLLKEVFAAIEQKIKYANNKYLTGIVELFDITYEINSNQEDLAEALYGIILNIPCDLDKDCFKK